MESQGRAVDSLWLQLGILSEIYKTVEEAVVVGNAAIRVWLFAHGVAKSTPGAVWATKEARVVLPRGRFSALAAVAREQVVSYLDKSKKQFQMLEYSLPHEDVVYVRNGTDWNFCIKFIKSTPGKQLAQYSYSEVAGNSPYQPSDKLVIGVQKLDMAQVEVLWALGSKDYYSYDYNMALDSVACWVNKLETSNDVPALILERAGAGIGCNLGIGGDIVKIQTAMKIADKLRQIPRDPPMFTGICNVTLCDSMKVAMMASALDYLYRIGAQIIQDATGIETDGAGGTSSGYGLRPRHTGDGLGVAVNKNGTPELIRGGLGQGNYGQKVGYRRLDRSSEDARVARLQAMYDLVDFLANNYRIRLHGSFAGRFSVVNIADDGQGGYVHKGMLGPQGLFDRFNKAIQEEAELDRMLSPDTLAIEMLGYYVPDSASDFMNPLMEFEPESLRGTDVDSLESRKIAVVLALSGFGKDWGVHETTESDTLYIRTDQIVNGEYIGFYLKLLGFEGAQARRVDMMPALSMTTDEGLAFDVVEGTVVLAELLASIGREDKIGRCAELAIAIGAMYKGIETGMGMDGHLVDYYRTFDAAIMAYAESEAELCESRNVPISESLWRMGRYRAMEWLCIHMNEGSSLFNSEIAEAMWGKNREAKENTAWECRDAVEMLIRSLKDGGLLGLCYPEQEGSD